jgi:hypothetical protein
MNVSMSKLLGISVPLEGIEPPSTVPKTVVLSVELQRHRAVRGETNRVILGED